MPVPGYVAGAELNLYLLERSSPMTTSDRLKRLAELAGIPVFDCRDVGKSPQLPYVFEDISEVFWIRYKDHVSGDIITRIWGLESGVGRLVIADRLMQGPNWPKDWMVWPGHGVVKHNNWQKQDHSSVAGVAINGVHISADATPIDAVLAAMEERHE